MTEPQITQTRGTFTMSCGVTVNIHAEANKIWGMLTDPGDFPRWNSTVTRIDGEIRDGETLKVHVPGTDRAFAAKVSDVVPNERMIWSGGFAPVFKGVRTFELRSRDDGSTDFAMEERFSGLMLPLIKRSLPDFGMIFARYADDLKNGAERTSQ